ncbi:MAG: hypothetical protein WC423_22500, partial [Vulcanimicrobiota bacterium]
GELTRLQSALGDKRGSAGAAIEETGEREHLLAERVKQLTAELEEIRVARRDADQAAQQNLARVSNLTEQLDLLKLALEDKDNEFQVIADALVEAEEAAALLEREKQVLLETGGASVREENDRLTEEIAKLRQSLSAAERKDESRDNVETLLLERDKEIERLQAEIWRLQGKEAAGDGGEVEAPGRVAELEAELALSQRKLSRLEQTIIRLKGR